MTKCRKGFEIEVLRSGAGYYIGTVDEIGFPNCRISTGYFKDSIVAEKALEGFTFDSRTDGEIAFCNGGLGCLEVEEDLVPCKYAPEGKYCDGCNDPDCYEQELIEEQASFDEDFLESLNIKYCVKLEDPTGADIGEPCINCGACKQQ